MGQKVRKGYKAFDHGMKCRGKQYAENTIFEEQGAKDCCEAGVMHYCENPLDVLNHYPLIDDEGRVVEIAEVEPLAEVLRKDDKCATKKLKIGAKIKIGKLVEIAGEYLRETIKGKEKDVAVGGDDAKQLGGNYAKQVGGDYAQQLGGNYAQQLGGNYAQQIGGKLSKQLGGKFSRQIGGGCAQQIGGNLSKQLGGDYAQQIGGDDAKQIGGDYAQQLGGNYAQQLGGNYAQQLGGDSSKQEAGRNSVIMAGPGSFFKAGLHSVILFYWYDNDCNIADFKAVQVDGEKIKADTWYRLVDGEFVEA